MDLGEDKTEIEKLSQMLSKIQNLYYKKKDQLEELQQEITELRDVLNFLNSFISNKSFQSADKLYSESLQKIIAQQPEDQYFVEEVPKERVKGTNIKRKIFANENENDKDAKLLCVLNFLDFNQVEIKIVNPIDSPVRETSEEFIRIFLRGALLRIKDSNPELLLEYDHFKDTDLIECIKVLNLKSIQDYDLITSKMRELLAKQVSN
ncbi:MAG: hypothetical protein ACXAES_13890 [Promethearchaeota archaeon]